MRVITVTTNTDRTAPAQLIGRLQRGATLLNRHSARLNQAGHSLLQRINTLQRSALTMPASDLVNQVGAIETQLPAITNPRLELFKRPDIEVIREGLAKGNGIITLEIIYGCENQCIFCAAEAPNKITTMYFIEALLIADVVRELGGKITISFGRSEPILWRDTLFGANFADLIEAIQDIYVDTQSSTHGWPEGHKFAQSAAEKLNRMGLRFNRLSLHLFHDDLLGSDVPEESFEYYARQFVRAITLLRPQRIGLRGFNGPRAAEDPRHLSLEYTYYFFIWGIMELLPEDLQNYYSEKLTEENAQEFFRQIGRDRDWWVGPFDIRSIRAVRNTHARRFKSAGGLGPAGFAGIPLPKHYRTVSDFSQGAGLFVHVDSSYVLDEWNAQFNRPKGIPRQVWRTEGNLF